MRNIIFILVAALILSGCIPNLGNRSAPKAAGEFVKGKVVAGFPNLPLYPKAQIVQSYGQNGAYGASFVSDEDLVKVVNFYGESLKPLGWEATFQQVSKTNYVYNVKNARFEGSVIINTASDGKATAITISVKTR